jgi:aspartate/methionine/tyrosine aminotransferase
VFQPVHARGRLLQRGVHTVPCRPFYWAQPDEGEHYLRVALSRNPEAVESAVEAIREVVAGTVVA